MQIKYSDCRDPKDPTLGERSSEEVLYLLPDTQRFLEVSSVYLSDSDELEIRFDVRFNSARICWSRASPEEQVSVTLNQSLSPSFRNGFNVLTNNLGRS